VPGDVEEYTHVVVDVPPGGKLTLAGQDTATPVGAVTLRLTGPDRPKRLVSVTVPVVEEFDEMETEDAEILKSMMVTTSITEWLREPLVPLIVTA